MKKDRKIVQLLQACTPEELPALRRFVESPYFNRHTWLAELLDYLLERRHALEEIDPGHAFAVVLPGQPYDDKRWRYMLSDLGVLIERFWTIEHYESDERRVLPDRMALASERGIDKMYRQTERRVIDLLEGHDTRNSAFFEFALKSSEQAYLHFTRQKLRRYDPGLQAVSDNLDRFYYLQKLRFAVAMLENRQILQGDYQTGISASWLQHLEAADFFGEPLIRLYHAALRAQEDENDETLFENLRTMLVDQERSMPVDDLRSVYQLAINYCARKIRQGKDAFVSEALELYNDGIERKLFSDAGHLSPWAFSNVIKLALRLKRFDWIEEFIQKYGPDLAEDFRQNVLHYNLAELYFYTNRYDEAQQALHKVAMNDLIYYLGARVLLVKIYFETREINALLSLLSAFIAFLKRNREISSNLKQTYLNFCTTVFQLSKPEIKNLERLRENIRTTPLLTDREWLLNMLAKR
jgi:hypothetical protein